MADNLASSEPTANSAASRGFEPFFLVATPAVRRRCLVAVGNCFPSNKYTLVAAFACRCLMADKARHGTEPVVGRKAVDQIQGGMGCSRQESGELSEFSKRAGEWIGA